MKSHTKYYFILITLILVFFIIDLNIGSYYISFKDILSAIFGGDVESENIKTIVLEFRLPRAITAAITGMALSVCGLLMQSYFRNPLAGPYVLGVSSGASFGVAVFLLLGSSVVAGFGNIGMSVFALAGSFFTMFVLLTFGKSFKGNASLLIIGLMLSIFLGALINILEYFSKPNELQSFVLWTFGSLNGVEWKELLIIIPVISVALLYTFKLTKPLNAILLGERYAQSMGISIEKLKWQIIIITTILTAIITAYCGPIAFIGIATPHLVRYWIKTSNHAIILPLVILTGTLIMLICDILSQVPGFSFVLPINVITSLFGAPIVILVIIKNMKQYTINE
ncbi:MAG: iron ABC transporter permease [Vicingaceae bacterium]